MDKIFEKGMEKVVEKAFETTGNLVDHYSKLEEDWNELNSECQVLKRRKVDINSRIETEVRSGQVVKEEVKGWLEDVQEMEEYVQAVEERVRNVSRSNRISLDKQVREKIKEVKRIQERGNCNEGLVVERAPACGMVIPTENLEGEISTKAEIREHLMGNEVGMIGVCGIGGVGKTTIMKHVNNELLMGGRFQKVIWVTVSYPLNVLELQKKIARAMGITLPEDEEEMMRAAALMDKMGRVRFVLILDDVWEKFSLQKVGIPEPVQNKSKVVITTRSIEVCKYLGCRIVKVQPLSPKESLNLFLKTVGDGVLQVSGLEDILKLIVEECAGLPLAIVVIAGSMRGVDDVNVWRNALTELRERVKSVSGWNDEIFQRLRFSYDRLDGLDIQKCFLYCSLFREDYEFSRSELIEGWIDDGLIDIDDFGSRTKAYDRGHAFLDKLVKNCLIEKIAKVNRFEDGFKMHDVVRDMAIKSIGPEFGYMVKELRKVPNERGWAKDFRKLSLMPIHISKLPVGLSLKCPNLSTLILSDNRSLSEIPESFFDDMCALKVLDLSRTGIEALPDSLCKLENLATLRFRGCRRLKCLPSLRGLRALKKLDLKGARIPVVPQGMETLESLEYLDLFCWDLKQIPTGILSKLSNLQYLAICYLRRTPQGIDLKGVVRLRKSEILEVARLRKLEILECRFDDIKNLNSFVSEYKNFQTLTAYRLVVGGGLFPDYVFGRDEKFSYHGGDYECWLDFRSLKIGGECVFLPDNLEHLRIESMENMTSSSFNKIVLLENATELRRCSMSNCKGIECVLELDSSSSSSFCCPILDKLEVLTLESLPDLSVVVRMEGVATTPQVFSNLKDLYAWRCEGMRKLLPLELVQALQNLEEITVGCCDQMEEIIASSDSDASSDKFTFTFPKLRKLRLVALPQLKSICSAKGVMVCDSIEEIEINDCPGIKRIPLQLPLLENGQPSPPPRLREINIIDEIDDMARIWWESVEWDQPNAQKIVKPFLRYKEYPRNGSIFGSMSGVRPLPRDTDIRWMFG